MKKVNLLMILLSGVVLSFSGWASATATTSQETEEDLRRGDLEVLRQKVYNATAQNEQLTAEIERARLLEQLRIQEEKTAALTAEKAVSPAPVVVGRPFHPLSSRVIACRNHVPITVMNAERRAWVNACINHLVETAW